MMDLDKALSDAAAYLDVTPLSDEEKNELEMSVSYELSLTENEPYDHLFLAAFISDSVIQQEN